MAITVIPLPETRAAEAAAVLAASSAGVITAPVAREKLFGDAPAGPATPLAVEGDDGAVVGVAVVSDRWLRLIAVHPDARGRGIGTTLLEHAEVQLKQGSHLVARTADQPGNYLAPGIDEGDPTTIQWLERRGWNATGINTNLLIDVESNPAVDAARAEQLAETARAQGYEIRRAGPGDREFLSTSITREFSGEWAFEAARALDGSPAGVHIALYQGDLAGFAAHDGNNQGLGWFGPAGTVPEHRRRGLGRALLLPCLLDVAAAGHAQCTIAWIGPRPFYERSVGVVGERRYIVLTKDLS